MVRTALGLPAEQLAAAVGCSPHALSRLERGKRALHDGELPRLLHALADLSVGEKVRYVRRRAVSHAA